MSFFITEEQEYELNKFLDEQNRIVVEEQLESEEIPAEYKEMMSNNLEEGAAIPFFNPEHGYYSISFTPCAQGNRIYVHHHITNNSHKIFDPSSVTIIDDSIQKQIDDEDRMIEELNEKLNQSEEHNYETIDVDLTELSVE